jgi:hypothetical protein
MNGIFLVIGRGFYEIGEELVSSSARFLRGAWDTAAKIGAIAVEMVEDVGAEMSSRQQPSSRRPTSRRKRHMRRKVGSGRDCAVRISAGMSRPRVRLRSRRPVEARRTRYTSARVG